MQVFELVAAQSTSKPKWITTLWVILELRLQNFEVYQKAFGKLW